jgi:exosome complex exonuclease DIS3/RRP44
MLQQQTKGFYKRTRKGKVIKVVQESYLRNDLECGSRFGKLVNATDLKNIVNSAPHKHIIVIDTNIAVHQIDVLEYNCPEISVIVMCQTLLQELRHINLSIFRRTLALLKDETKTFLYYANEFSSKTAISRY